MHTSDHPTEYREPNTPPGATSESEPGPASRASVLRDGVTGGVVALLLSFLPLSTVLGGATAGYLDADGGRHAAAGAIAGVVAFLPYPIAALYVVSTPASALPGPVAALSPVVVAAAATVALVYAVGLSVLGSFPGRYLYRRRHD